MLSKADKIDVKKFLEARLQDSMPLEDGVDITGNFKEFEPNNKFLSLDISSSYDDIIIAKIPAGNPWELAVWVPMGGFNGCPAPEEQAAVFKYWHEKYGAVPAVVSYDIWEMKAEKPPLTYGAAETLAKEQFAFCPDIVYQAGGGWDSIRGLASQLKNSAVWFFWWD
jgi:hypothetical protein